MISLRSVRSTSCKQISSGNLIHLFRPITSCCCKQCNYIQLRGSALTNWATESSCRALITSSCIFHWIELILKGFVDWNFECKFKTFIFIWLYVKNSSAFIGREPWPTRVKTLRLMQYWWKQDWTMFCCPHCSQLSTILNNIATPDSGS
jgi:hypothetical protein